MESKLKSNFARLASLLAVIAGAFVLLALFLGGLGHTPTWAGTTHIELYDILPPTHAVVALNKVFTLGAGFQEVSFELGMLMVLSVVYFAVGAWLFQRLHIRR